MSTETNSEPRLLIPALESFYNFARPFAWFVVRFGVGLNLAIHGWGKVQRGMVPQSKVLDLSVPYLHDYNLMLSYLLTFVEGVGGVCIMLGLFTRFFAAANAIEMGFLTFVVYWGTGFAWLAKGYEYTLLWGFMCLAIALRGGGPYSLDKKIGVEL